MNIKTLLNKKAWTGAEIGKALIATLADDARHRGQEHEPILSQADFDRMLNSLETEPQIGAYLVYQKIYSSVVDSFNRVQALEQQFLHGYYRYIMQLEEIQQADHALKAVESYPLILSQKQYDRLHEQATAEKRGYETTFYGILFDLLEYYIAHEDTAPAAIKKAIEACRKEPATNQRILQNYCYDLGMGYYRLPDGTESRSCTSEEWQQACERAWLEKHKGFKAEYQKHGIESVMKAYNQDRYLKMMHLIFSGEEALKKRFEEATGKPFDESEHDFTMQDLIEEMLAETSSYGSSTSKEAAHYASQMIEKNTTEWITEELPADVSKYDIISEPDLLLYYSDGIENVDLTAEEQLAEFKADYPKLFSALQAELKKQLNIKRIYPNKIYTWGELADLGIADYSLYTEVSDTDIISVYCKADTEKDKQNRIRAAYRGIAIIPEGSRSFDIDPDTGDYIEPVNPYTEINNLDNITIEEAEQIETYISVLLEPAARFILAYNALLDILAISFNIPDLQDLKADLQEFETKAYCFNNILYMTYAGMSGSQEEKARKRQLLKDYFREIEWEKLKPAKENIEEVRGLFDNMKLSRSTAEKLNGFDPYIELLMREGAANEE